MNAVNYIEDLASAIRDEIDPQFLPVEDSERLFNIYAVLALSRGTTITSEDVHNAWAAWMTSQDRNHEALVPFEDLDAATAESDRHFAEAIRRVAQNRAIQPLKAIQRDI